MSDSPSPAGPSDSEAWTASELDAGAVSDLLEDAGYGVLALANDGESYAVPMSFGFDGDSTIYFQFGFGEGSVKRAFLDATSAATLVVHDVRTCDDWHSVVVTGPIDRVPESRSVDAFAALSDNAVLPRNALDDRLTAADFELYRLDVESATGRRGH
jgi:hypothetical protein